MRISWSAILQKYVHGDLLGYKITYKLTKVAGSANVMPSANIQIIHPSLTTVMITGLQTNAQYSFQVLAFNAYGDGVLSAAVYGGVYVPIVYYTIINNM